MTTESRDDFTVAELDEALDGDHSEGYWKVEYKTKPLYIEKYNAGPTTTSRFSAERDEQGFPIRASATFVSPDDEDFDEDEVTEQTEEFWYEGGYVSGIGYFKMLANGNLGDGHEAWAVIEHQGSGRTFRKSGYYSSWESGTVLDSDLIEVVPAEVKVVRYRPIDGGEVFENPAVNVV